MVSGAAAEPINRPTRWSIGEQCASIWPSGAESESCTRQSAGFCHSLRELRIAVRLIEVGADWNGNRETGVSINSVNIAGDNASKAFGTLLTDIDKAIDLRGRTNGPAGRICIREKVLKAA